jgi:hypothetical protein
VSTEFSFEKSWTTSDPDAVSRVAGALAGRLRLKLEESAGDTEAVLRGGSQLRTRLLGGWFIAPEHLPKRVQVSAAPGSSSLDVRVEDALGSVAVRDRRFKARYEKAAESIFELVDAAV